MKVKLICDDPCVSAASVAVLGRNHGRCILAFDSCAELERIRWYPKDGELCLGKTKPEETLVEVCSDSDVQIDRQTWV
jgi:hypothetical protein